MEETLMSEPTFFYLLSRVRYIFTIYLNNY